MIALCVALTCASTVSALSIHPPQSEQPPTIKADSVLGLSRNITPNEGTSKLHLSLPTVELLNQANVTSLSNISVSAQPAFVCDEGWGRDLNLQMCLETLASIPWLIGPERRPISFGPRETNTFDIGLPRRFMSCESSCFLLKMDTPTLTSEQLMGSAPSSPSSHRKRRLPMWPL